MPPPVTLSPDDLTIIEGIGPKIDSVLKSAGINTLYQLAAAGTSEIRHILRSADIQLADPATWAEQARLAAEGDFEALYALQDQHKVIIHAAFWGCGRDGWLTRLKLRRAGVPNSPAIRRVVLTRRVLGPAVIAVANVANVANVNRDTPILREPMYVWM